MQSVNRHAGFTLIEATAMMAIMAIVATVILNHSLTTQQDMRFQQTKARYQQVRDAILKVQTVNGQTVVSGFVADMGRLPYNLHELMDSRQVADSPWLPSTACTDGNAPSYVNGSLTPACTSNSSAQPIPVGMGWRGPYLQTSGTTPNQHNAFTDGWGGLQFDISNPNPVTCQTAGANTYYNPLLALDGNTYCKQVSENQNTIHEGDINNYGWLYFTHADHSGAYLLSYGADKLPGQNSPLSPHVADWPDIRCVDSQLSMDNGISVGNSDCLEGNTHHGITSKANINLSDPALINGNDWLIPVSTIVVNLSPQAAACLYLGIWGNNGECLLPSISSCDPDNYWSCFSDSSGTTGIPTNLTTATTPSDCQHLQSAAWNTSNSACVAGTPNTPRPLYNGQNPITQQAQCNSPFVVWENSTNSPTGACYARIFMNASTGVCPTGFAGDSPTPSSNTLCTLASGGSSQPPVCLLFFFRSQDIQTGAPIPGVAYINGVINSQLGVFTNTGNTPLTFATGTLNTPGPFLPAGQNAISLLPGSCPSTPPAAGELIVDAGLGQITPQLFLPGVTAPTFNY